MTLAVVLLVMIAGGMFWYWHALPKQAPAKKNSTAVQRREPAKKHAPAKAPASSDTTAHNYQAVSIQCRADACAAAKAIAGKRFLTAAAPTLPLAGCGAAQCHCSYARHADQRSDEDDRRSVHSLQTELFTRTAAERRKRRGRRRTDRG